MRVWESNMQLGGIYPPVIIDNYRDENTVWVVADGIWFSAPRGVTLDRVRSQWTGRRKPETQNPVFTTKEVLSSNGKTWYTVTFRNGEPFSCTCPGHGFRGRCRHGILPKKS